MAVKTQVPSQWLVVDPLATTPLPPTARQRRWEQVGTRALAAIPFGIVALGVFVRIWGLDLAPFGEPQAAELSAARRLASATDWHAWATRTELLVVMHAAVLAVSDRVEVWLGVRALMDAAAIWLVYLSGRALSGRLVGVAAAGILALAPASWTAVRDSAAHSSPLMLALAVWLSTKLLSEGGARWAVPLAVLAGALARLEPGHVAFGLALVATVALSQPRTLAVVAVGVLYGLLAASPVAHLLSQSPGWIGGDVAAAGAAIGLVAGPAEASAWASVPMAAVGWVASLCAVIAVSVGTAVVARGWRTERRWLIPLLWGLAPLLGLVLAGQPPQHVAVTSIPAVALVAACALAGPAGSWWKLSRRLSRVSVVILIASHGASLTALAATAGDEGIGTTAPLRAWANVAGEAIEAAERTGAAELLVLAVDGPFAGAGELLGGLLGPRLALRQIPPGVVPLPVERDALYLLLPGAAEPSVLLRPSARYAAVEIPGTAEPVRVVSLRPRPPHQWLAESGASATTRFADGTFVLSRSVP